MRQALLRRRTGGSEFEILCRRAIFCARDQKILVWCCQVIINSYLGLILSRHDHSSSSGRFYNKCTSVTIDSVHLQSYTMDPELFKYQSTHPSFHEWPPRSVLQLTTLQDSDYDADDSGDSPIRNYQDLPDTNESSPTLNQHQLPTLMSSNTSINDSGVFFNAADMTTNTNTKKKQAKK